MTPSTTALQKHFEELERLHDRLLRVAEARLQAMAARDVARLEFLLAEERQLAMAIHEGERRRRNSLIRLAGELGLKPQQIPSLKMSDLAARLAEPERGRLMAQRTRLRALAERVQQVNGSAVQLAQRCLPYFEELLGILLDGAVGRPTYTPDGQATRAGASGMSVLDLRA